MTTFKTRAFRTSKLKGNKGLEKELRMSGRFSSKPIIFSSIKSNILFEKVVETFRLNFNSRDNIKGEVEEVDSIVENGSVYTISSSPSFKIYLGNSWLRITPNKFGGLHLSRLQVDQDVRGNGIGSILLSTFSKLILISIGQIIKNDIDYITNLPIIDLEVLNFFGNGIKVDVKRAVSLYERFGFSVVENGYGYVRMELNIVEMRNYILELDKEFNKLKK